MFTWLQGLAITALVSGVVGLGGGWYARDKFCDAKEARAKLAHEQALNQLLANRLQTMQEAASQHAERVAADNARIAELEKQIADIPANPAPCGDDKAFDALRGIR